MCFPVFFGLGQGSRKNFSYIRQGSFSFFKYIFKIYL